MKLIRRIFRWIADRLKDLFYDPSNQSLDAGRVVGVLSALSLLIGAIWNARLGKELDLGPAGLGGGLGAVLGAAAYYILRDRKQSAQGASITINTDTP